MAMYEYTIENVYDDFDIFYTESGLLQNIGLAFEKIKKMIKTMVENFKKMMEKHHIDKTIDDINKLDPNTKIEMEIDPKKCFDSYDEMLNVYNKNYGYADEGHNQKIVIAVEKSKKNKNHLFKKVVVTASTLATILLLLKGRNNYKNYQEYKIRDQYINDMYENNKNIKKVFSMGMRTKMELLTGTNPKNINKNKEKLNAAKENIQKKIDRSKELTDNMNMSIKALQESEFYRLKLYTNIRKSLKSILNYTKGTVVYGVKGLSKFNYANASNIDEVNDVKSKFSYGVQNRALKRLEISKDEYNNSKNIRNSKRLKI